MENKKSKRFSRAQLDIKEQNKITDLTKRIKCMSVPDLEKFPLYKGGEGITKYNHGDVIRYKNGSILYIMENQLTHEKVPTLITVIKDLKVIGDINPELTKKIIKKTSKKKSKKSVKISSNPLLIDSNKALTNFDIYYKLLKKKQCIINITNTNFIGKEYFIDKKTSNLLPKDDGNDSELDYDEEISAI
jgi:hypothetical protein